MTRATCPDGGHCHHDCRQACFRVLTCEPLSGVFPGDRWPEAVTVAERLRKRADGLCPVWAEGVGWYQTGGRGLLRDARLLREAADLLEAASRLTMEKPG